MHLEVKTIQGLGRNFHFVLDSEVDHIQSVLRTGEFYELEELELIAEIAGEPKRILDVGSNIGNHSIFFAHRFDADLVVPVEPNRRVLPLLRANLGLNWHPSYDLSLVGYGLSDRDGFGVSKVSTEANLGGAKLVIDTVGDVQVTSGDIAFPSITFDLIKIDVEGMENLVIQGMNDLLRRSNATVFVEVLLSNIDLTIHQMRSHGYRYLTS
ncbi:MAG: FkbM family methyltransferase [Erythrobacter sp.]